MTDLEQHLKNPVWYALNETHQDYKVAYGQVSFYDPLVCRFGAFLDPDEAAEASLKYCKNADIFFYVLEDKTPIIDSEVIQLVKKVDCIQMVLKKLSDIETTEEIVELDTSYMEEIYDLIWLVMPGYYEKRTFELGKYFGIIKNGKLVSVTGQRLQTNSFTEVSGVVTHPDYTRRGLARQLIHHTTKAILSDNKTPILHTNKGNSGISLYSALGYAYKRDMNWWMYAKKEL